MRLPNQQRKASFHFGLPHRSRHRQYCQADRKRFEEIPEQREFPWIANQSKIQAVVEEPLAEIAYFCRKNGRGSKIRTCDPLVPNQMRYQAALYPDPLIGSGVSAFASVVKCE